MIAAERVRGALKALSIDSPKGVRVPVTASFGLAVFCPGESVDSLVDRADRAMYEAKSAGRNRVVLARAELPVAPLPTEPEVVDAGVGAQKTDQARG